MMLFTPPASGAPSTVSAGAPESHVLALRSFNRFYTQRIGVLSPYLGSRFSLTEARVLYELAHRDQPTASELRRDLMLDAGYLSRILRGFEGHGWLERAPSPEDARQSLLRLTALGREVFAPLEKQSADEASALLGKLAPSGQQRLVGALAAVQDLLSPQPEQDSTTRLVLRSPQPGDVGWVVQQHGEIYAREYGWNSDFEALVADIAGKFLKNFKPDAEKCWIAELEGVRAGAVFVVRKSSTVCQLRMLILTPQARGLGIGGRLTDECITFARSKGYKKMRLWTNSCLDAARAIYARRGFTLLESEPYHGFGQDLVSETWELRL